MESFLKGKVSIKKLERIHNIKGDVLRCLKSSEEGFLNFGEAYFSIINYGQIKGWKKHTLMQLNLVVPVGSIKFYLVDDESQEVWHVTIGIDNYSRLTIDPGVWVAFEGLEDYNLLLNIASIEHDPLEAINQPLGHFLHYFK